MARDTEHDIQFAVRLTPHQRKIRIEEMLTIYSGLSDALEDELEITKDDKVIKDGLSKAQLLGIACQATLGFKPNRW